jgi:hypothetical protein
MMEVIIYVTVVLSILLIIAIFGTVIGVEIHGYLSERSREDPRKYLH